MLDRAEAYSRSVSRALRDCAKRDRTAPWVRYCLDRLFVEVPCSVPYDLIALLGVRTQTSVIDPSWRVDVGLMLEKGWSLDQSVMIFRNFKMAHPKLRYHPHVLRTFTRQQLRDELGTTYGNVIADLCADPGSQPVFAALLFGELDQPIERQFCVYETWFTVHERAINDIFALGGVPPNCMLTSINTADIRQDGRTLLAAEAAYTFESKTGTRLTLHDDINPRSFDYDLAAIRAALRQAGGDLYPYDQASYEG